MKKLFFISTMIMLSFMFYQAAEARTIFSADYNTLTAGSTIYSFVNLSSIAQTDPENSANMVNKLTFSSSAPQGSLSYDMEYENRLIVFKSKFRFEDYGLRASISLISNNITKAVFTIGAEGICGNQSSPLNDGIMLIQGTQMQLNRWYDVEIHMNLNHDKYDVYMDGVKVTPDSGLYLRYASTMKYSSAGVTNTAITFTGTSTTSKSIYLDNTELTCADTLSNDETVNYTQKPVIFHTSDMALPNETVLLYGGNFGTNPTIKIGEVTNGNVTTPQTGIVPQVSQWTTLGSNNIFDLKDSSVKVVIPSSFGNNTYAITVENQYGISDPVYINSADVWWIQGNEGKTATQNGWIRVLGKGLAFDQDASVDNKAYLVSGVQQYLLSEQEWKDNSITLTVGNNVPVGEYTLYINNGYGGDAMWQNAGLITIEAEKTLPANIFNVVSTFGAQPNNSNFDCTNAIQNAILAARKNGGVVYLPRGRYMVTETLTIPENVVLMGEDMRMVSLYWPATATPFVLISGQDNFSVQNLSIYTYGYHLGIIQGNSNVKIKNVYINANAYYHHSSIGILGGTSTFTAISRTPSSMGAGISIKGNNFEITDCEIINTNLGFVLQNSNYGYIARNKIYAGQNPCQLYAVSKIIYEDNYYRGTMLFASGMGISLYGGAANYNIYYEGNKMEHLYGGDRESMTFDGHGTAYIGSITQATAKTVTLSEDAVWGTDHKDKIQRWDMDLSKRTTDSEWHGITVYILDGKGAGQYRNIVGMDGKTIWIDKPWDILPDATSTLSIGKFNGRQLFVNNEYYDAGTAVQLYAPGIDNIVKDNKCYRISSLNANGSYSVNLGVKRVEPCWFNTFIGNTIEVGNSWTSNGTGVTITGGNSVDSMPIARGNVIKNNILRNNSRIQVSSASTDIIIEGNDIRNTDIGINIVKTTLLIPNYLDRNNTFTNVTTPIIR